MWAKADKLNIYKTCLISFNMKLDDTKTIDSNMDIKNTSNLLIVYHKRLAEILVLLYLFVEFCFCFIINIFTWGSIFIFPDNTSK